MNLDPQYNYYKLVDSIHIYYYVDDKQFDPNRLSCIYVVYPDIMQTDYKYPRNSGWSLNDLKTKYRCHLTQISPEEVEYDIFTDKI